MLKTLMIKLFPNSISRGVALSISLKFYTGNQTDLTGQHRLSAALQFLTKHLLKRLLISDYIPIYKQLSTDTKCITEQISDTK